MTDDPLGLAECRRVLAHLSAEKEVIETMLRLSETFGLSDENIAWGRAKVRLAEATIAVMAANIKLVEDFHEEIVGNKPRTPMPKLKLVDDPKDEGEASE